MAVLEFAKLMASTGKEARVRSNAEAIAHESRIDEPVSIAGLVRELAPE